MMPLLSEEEKEQFKQAVKEAAREWLDDQFSAFGKWTAIGISSAAFFVMVKFFVVNGTWPK